MNEVCDLKIQKGVDETRQKKFKKEEKRNFFEKNESERIIYIRLF